LLGLLGASRGKNHHGGQQNRWRAKTGIYHTDRMGTYPHS
jgi:hypothetical protein